VSPTSSRLLQHHGIDNCGQRGPVSRTYSHNRGQSPPANPAAAARPFGNAAAMRTRQHVRPRTRNRPTAVSAVARFGKTLRQHVGLLHPPQRKSPRRSSYAGSNRMQTRAYAVPAQCPTGVQCIARGRQNISFAAGVVVALSRCSTPSPRSTPSFGAARQAPCASSGSGQSRDLPRKVSCTCHASLRFICPGQTDGQ